MGGFEEQEDAGGAVDVDLNGHDAWLMPREPADASAVLQSLGSLEHSGIEFIVIPSAAFDWLEDHPEVPERLRRRHRFVTRQQHRCEIYELVTPDAGRPLQRSAERQAPDREGYSGFEGTALESILREHDVDTVHVAGLALDYCVRATALDARREGFDVTVDREGVRGIDAEPGDVEKALEEIRTAGGTVA